MTAYNCITKRTRFSRKNAALPKKEDEPLAETSAYLRVWRNAFLEKRRIPVDLLRFPQRKLILINKREREIGFYFFWGALRKGRK